jgi:hypothetical protein
MDQTISIIIPGNGEIAISILAEIQLHNYQASVSPLTTLRADRTWKKPAEATMISALENENRQSIL